VTSCLEIDLAQLRENLDHFGKRVGPVVKICGVVKADAYGLGAIPIARCLAISGIEFLAVYSPAQAAVLEESGVVCPMMVLMPIRWSHELVRLERAISQERLHLTIHDEPQLEQVNELGRHFGCRIAVHLHLDTGMSRGGLDVGQLGRILAAAPKCKFIRIAGLGTHFAAADDDPEFSEQQLGRLIDATDPHRAQLPHDLLIHASNTFGVLRDRRFHQTMVRVGLGLYGYGPRLMQYRGEPDMERDLCPIVRWSSELVHVHNYSQGSPVGYNCTYRLARPSRLGLVPVGYADGYPLSLGGISVVGIMSDSTACHVAPVLGKVNMDQIVVDLTDVPFPVDVGTPVELISSDPDSPYALERLAEQAGSSCYELLCRLSARIPRRYLGGE